MTRTTWIHIGFAMLIALMALFLISLHNAGGAALDSDSATSGHRLAEAWCRTCHAIDANTAGTSSNAAPDFARVANQPSTTALALKVFLRTSHPTMPNLVLTPAQADDLANYILSLKRN
jgi:cytochrome c